MARAVLLFLLCPLPLAQEGYTVNLCIWGVGVLCSLNPLNKTFILGRPALNQYLFDIPGLCAELARMVWHHGG